MTKIIFLDIDGVLNSAAYDLSTRREKFMKVKPFDYWQDIDPGAVAVLNTIIDETSACVVVSSTWRLSRSEQELTDILGKQGFAGNIIGKTPRCGEDTVRGCEIHKWIKNNPAYTGEETYKYKNYVILDDDSDMLYWQRDNFICVNGDTGLTVVDAVQAIKILNQEVV